MLVKDGPHPIVSEMNGYGTQKLYRFDNGYGASVVQFSLTTPIGTHGAMGSYGVDKGLWELAVTEWAGEKYEITYDTPITDDVLGHLPWDEVERVLTAIEILTPSSTLRPSGPKAKL